MRKYLGNYKKYYTETFEEKLGTLRDPLKRLVDEKISDILNDPWRNSKAMKGPYRGKRRRWINDEDRIIYVSCEECRENSWKSYNLCSDCDETPEDLVIFVNLIFGHEY